MAKNKYRVIIGCQSDKTGKRYEPGDTCTGADFPARVIGNWLEIGVLAVEPEEVEDGGGKE